MRDKNLNAYQFQDAQHDMSMGYGSGSVGVFISGTVWLIAGLIVHFQSDQRGIWALIIGGVFIFPLATLTGKLIGIKGKHDKRNPLGKLAMEGTVWMIMCIPLAYGLSMIKTAWFFQGMLLIIAGRYLTFATLYGMRLYWILGATLGAAAYVLFKMGAGSFLSALTGCIIEMIFGIVIYSLYLKGNQKNRNVL